MLELVFANGDVSRGIEKNIGGHKNWVVKNTDVSGTFSFAFFFVLDHTAGFAHCGDAVENPTEFAVGRDERLAIKVNIIVD